MLKKSGLQTVWPDAEMKSSQIVSKRCQKGGQSKFLHKRDLFENSPNIHEMFYECLGHFCTIFLPSIFKNRPIWSHCRLQTVSKWRWLRWKAFRNFAKYVSKMWRHFFSGRCFHSGKRHGLRAIPISKFCNIFLPKMCLSLLAPTSSMPFCKTETLTLKLRQDFLHHILSFKPIFYRHVF